MPRELAPDTVEPVAVGFAIFREQDLARIAGLRSYKAETRHNFREHRAARTHAKDTGTVESND